MVLDCDAYIEKASSLISKQKKVNALQHFCIAMNLLGVKKKP
jgi:hypothetical protein